MLNGLHDDTHCAIATDGVVINKYDMIIDFRGDAWRFLGITRVPTGASTGRIYAQSCNDSNHKSEVFPSVFDLTIHERSN